MESKLPNLSNNKDVKIFLNSSLLPAAGQSPNSFADYMTDYGKDIVKSFTIPKDKNGKFSKCMMYDVQSGNESNNIITVSKWLHPFL